MQAQLGPTRRPRATILWLILWLDNDINLANINASPQLLSDLIQREILMKTTLFSIILALLVIGCSSNVRFVQTDDSYVIRAKPNESEIVFRQDQIKRPHKVIGVIEATLGKGARRPELNALLIQKAKEIGADAIMLVDYDVDRTVYLERHHAVVGRGPFRTHIVSAHPRAKVEKSAKGIAVIFR